MGTLGNLVAEDWGINHCLAQNCRDNVTMTHGLLNESLEVRDASVHNLICGGEALLSKRGRMKRVQIVAQSELSILEESDILDPPC